MKFYYRCSPKNCGCGKWSPAFIETCIKNRDDAARRTGWQITRFQDGDLKVYCPECAERWNQEMLRVHAEKPRYIPNCRCTIVPIVPESTESRMSDTKFDFLLALTLAKTPLDKEDLNRIVDAHNASVDAAHRKGAAADEVQRAVDIVVKLAKMIVKEGIRKTTCALAMRNIPSLCIHHRPIGTGERCIDCTLEYIEDLRKNYKLAMKGGSS